MKFKKIICAIILASFAARVSFAQWQQIGKEQLPSNLGDTAADSLTTDMIRATDATGLSLEDDAGILGVFVEDGGQVGIGTSSPDAALEVVGVSVLGVIGRFHATAASVQTYHRLVIDTPLDEDSQVSFMDNSSTKWSLGNDGSNDHFVIRQGPGAFGTSDFFALDTSGNLSAVGDGEFGSDSNTLVLYQSAADCLTSNPVTYLASDDAIHPASSDEEIHVSLPCPWSAPGTRIASVKFIFHVGDDDDAVNFAVKRQTSATPGTTNDVLAFGGSNYGRVSDLTNIAGNYYSKSGTADYTIAANEKVWAVVRLFADAAGSSCRLVGVEWTFEQRTY